MSGLRLPDQLEGAWESALILTYGADLAFYENALARKLRDSCRNRVVLCDGAAFQALCEEQRDGHLRHLGLRYLAAGIYMPQGVAHAKLILLLSPERGRLLVGSGNLGILGYTRNAELFAAFDYSAEQPEQLPEFLAVRELVEQLAARSYLHAPAAAQIRAMWDEAPWLYGAPSPAALVRHNLEASFLDQLTAAVAGREVRELVAMAPFLDERAQALRDVLDRLQPRALRLLLQRGRASADPAAVLRVLGEFGGESSVELFEVESEGGQRWAHAKMLLARLDDADLCLQGSPNLSQMALTRAGSEANLELASLLEGPSGSFDGFLKLLQCERAGDPASWSVRYERPAAPALPGEAGCRLRGGEIDGQFLVLDCTHAEVLSPPLCLSVDGRELALEVVRREGNRIWLSFPEELMGLVLESPLPVAISWQTADGAAAQSNALVLCVQPALRAVRQYRPSGERLQHLAALDLGDGEIEDLLHDFEQLLVIDRADVFRAAGRAEAAAASATDEEQTIYSLDDLDRDALRDHQRLRIYQRDGRGPDGGEDPLGALFAAITAQFKGMGAGSVAKLVPLIAQPIEAQTEAEVIAEVKGQEEIKAAAERRAWRLLKAFVRRFSKGLMSKEFGDFVGPLVVAMNYRVLLHFVTVLLARAADRPSWDDAWLAEQLSVLLEWYWGSETTSGVYRDLSDEERAQVDLELADSSLCAGLLLALSAAAAVAREQDVGEVLERLAGVGRRLLIHPPLTWPAGVVAEAMHASGTILASPPETATEFEADLRRMLDWESQASFLVRQAERYGLQPYGAYLEDRNLKAGIFCGLALEGIDVWRPEQVEQTLGDFMRFCTAPRYSVRLLTADGVSLATMLWQAEPASSCVLRDHLDGRSTVMEAATPAERPWDEPLAALFVAAPRPGSDVDPEQAVPSAVQALGRQPRLLRASEWPGELLGLDGPGLYAWWVNDAGAQDLSRGLGARVREGLLYVGQAGAESAAKAQPSSATLRSRIRGNHLGGNVRSSTLRCTLAAILAGPLALRIVGRRQLDPASEARLTEWMGASLSIAVRPTPPGIHLGELEREVVQTLEPPLNRAHLPFDERRRRLREQRALVVHGIDDLWIAPDPGLRDWRRILGEYGQAFDGYRYARLVRRCECSEVADDLWRFHSEQGRFGGSYGDLRCALFWLQRCVHAAEQSPGWQPDAELERRVQVLYSDILDEWEKLTGKER